MVSEIVERIRQKDQRAMSELYEMYVQELASVCRRYVADADDAKDVLQNSFIKIFAAIPTLDYRGEEAFRAWMRKVVVNEARVFLRDQKRHQTVQLAAATVTTDDEDTTASSEEITPAQLHRLISELPIGYRTVLNLFVFGHYSHRQIAQLLGIKEVTSATQFYYAKQRLARRIRELALAFSAAVVLLLAGLFVFVPSGQEAPQELTSELRQATGGQQPVTSRHCQPSNQHRQMAGVHSLATGLQRMRVATGAPDTIPMALPAAQQTATTAVTVATVPQQPLAVADTIAPTTEEQPATVAVEPTPAAEAPPAAPSNRWTVGLAGSDGLLAINTEERGLSVLEPQYDATSGTNTPPMPAALQPEPRYQHHRPLRLGLSLHYQISPRMALLTGVSYMMLKSDISLPSVNGQNSQQRLQYVGIPVGLSYQLWSTAHLHVYLSGMIQLEKCVGADVPAAIARQHPWQWSVGGVAGVEYSVSRLLGFYMEPSLGYYFNDGSSLQHYYKEHPLTPALQFGVRFHLGR